MTVYGINNMGWNKSDLCNQIIFENINPVLPPLSKAIEFLTIIYKPGVGYSPVATARSDLSSLNSTNGLTLGKQQ